MVGNRSWLEFSPRAEAGFHSSDHLSSTIPNGISVGDEDPLEALKGVVCGYVKLARRSPECGPLLFSDTELGHAEKESARALETIAAHVRAAQLAGAVKSGDPELITTLIVGAIVGAADLSQNGRVRAASGIRDLLSLPLFLIDRLTTKRCN